ncbi:nucleoporin Asm4p [Monosporozyma servazzii]
MNRFTGVSLLPQQQQNQQQQNQQSQQSQHYNSSNQQANLFNPNQQQQQNSLIQQQYMSATQPLNNNNNTTTTTNTNTNTTTTINNNNRQFNSNPVLPNNNNSNINNNSSSSNASPQWFTNTKKRTIPQNIVKRPTFKRGGADNNKPTHSSNKIENDSITNDEDKSGFNTMSFGSKKIITFHNNDKESQNNTNTLSTDTILNDSNEAPPMVSLHDWQREEEFGTMTNLSNNTAIGNSLFTLRSTKNNPMTLSNVKSYMSNVNAFDKDSSLKQSTNNNNNNNNTTTTTTNNEDSKQQQIEAFAIIVFGYPESVSNMIINHFAKFGNILEDFEVLRSVTGINKINNNNSNQTKKYPIFTGDGWTKLTYDSQASAIRALQENGKVITGCILGVVPYNKEVVEQLASCKISKDENIGENGIINSIQASTTTNTNTTTTPILPTLEKNNNTNNVNATPQSTIFNINTTTTTNNNNNNDNNHNDLSQNSKFTFNHRINVKDGKSLFIHNTNTNNHNFLQNLENKMRQQEELTQTINNTTTGINATSNVQGNNNITNNQGVLHSVNNWLFGWNNL